MNGLDLFYALLGLLAGLGVFIYGMKLMGDNLESVAGEKIKTMFAKISNNRLIGVGIGAGTTAVIQSSSAVTVMLIGFVNSGLMTLMQATAVIYGANIGTTVTAQIVALGYGGIEAFDLSAIFAAGAGVGAFMLMFSRSDVVRKIGAIIAGLGMIFVGLSVMGGSMEGVAESPEIVESVSRISNPMLLLLFGIAFTAIIQSSSAVSGLTITLAAIGMLRFDQAMYLIVGSNIGTCVTALLGSIGASTNAKRVAVVHLLFNVFGVIIFMLTDLFAHYGRLLPQWFSTTQLQIAMLHTMFNVATTIILFPLTKPLVRLATLIVPESKKKPVAQFGFRYLEDSFLQTPPIAVAQLKSEIVRMAELAKRNLDLATEAVLTENLSATPDMIKREAEINFLNKAIAGYMIRLGQSELSERDFKYLSVSYHTISDIERIGDYAENIKEYAEQLSKDQMHLSDNSKKEIAEAKAVLDEMFDATMQTYRSGNPDGIKEVYRLERIMDETKEKMGQKHVERLRGNRCNPEVGALYLSLSSDFERVADHLTNIAGATRYGESPEKKGAQSTASDTEKAVKE